MNEIQKDAVRYQRAQKTLDTLRKYRGLLTTQELKTLRGQALAGDIDGAEKGLARVVAQRKGY